MLSLSQIAFTGTDQAALAEWFVASVVLVVIVTFLYVYVLNRSPPPEGVTVAKLEQKQDQQVSETSNGSTILSQTHSSMLGGDYSIAVDLACRSATITLSSVLRATSGSPEGMNVSDLAYLIQSKATSCPAISESCYQLNLLRLKAAQGQRITQQEAEWAVSVASWLIQLVDDHQIEF